jgi:predicted esterase
MGLPSAKVLPAFRIVNGDKDTLITVSQAQRLQDALLKVGAKSTLTILHGAGHEDPRSWKLRWRQYLSFWIALWGVSPVVLRLLRLFPASS